jgi:hypothetical protein
MNKSPCGWLLVWQHHKIETKLFGLHLKLNYDWWKIQMLWKENINQPNIQIGNHFLVPLMCTIMIQNLEISNVI